MTNNIIYKRKRYKILTKFYKLFPVDLYDETQDKATCRAHQDVAKSERTVLPSSLSEIYITTHAFGFSSLNICVGAFIS